VAERNTVDQLVLKYTSITSQRDKAILEQEIYEAMTAGGKDFRFEDMRHIIPDVSGYDLQNRKYLLRNASDHIWKLIEEGLSLRQARKTLFEARKIAELRGQDIEECFKKIHQSILNESDEVHSKNGIFYKRKPGARKSTDWIQIEALASKLFAEELGEDGLDSDTLRTEFIVELKILIKQYKVKSAARRETVTANKNMLDGEEKNLRRQVILAFRDLGLDAPKPGKRPDMKLISRTYRRLAADNHPDKHGGQDHVLEKFRSVNNAYKLIERYDEFLHQKGQI
jgi:hypothetical protein